MRDVEIDIATYLGHTVSSLTLDTNLFYGYVREKEGSIVPGLAVFVLLTGGPGPIPLAGSGGIREAYSSVQIIVRGEKEDYPTAAALARSIFDAMAFQPITGYANCKPLQSGPISLGVDKNKHPVLSLNFEVLHYE